MQQQWHQQKKHPGRPAITSVVLPALLPLLPLPAGHNWTMSWPARHSCSSCGTSTPAAASRPLALPAAVPPKLLPPPGPPLPPLPPRPSLPPLPPGPLRVQTGVRPALRPPGAPLLPPLPPLPTPRSADFLPARAAPLPPRMLQATPAMHPRLPRAACLLQRARSSRSSSSSSSSSRRPWRRRRRPLPDSCAPTNPLLAVCGAPHTPLLLASPPSTTLNVISADRFSSFSFIFATRCR